MYELKIAGTDQVSFGPVPVLMVVKIIWSTVSIILLLNFCPENIEVFCKRSELNVILFNFLAGGPSESHKTVSQTKGSSNAGSKSDYQSKSKANQSVKSGSQPASKKSSMSVGEKQVAGDHTKSSQSNKPPKPTDNKVCIMLNVLKF